MMVTGSVSVSEDMAMVRGVGLLGYVGMRLVDEEDEEEKEEEEEEKSKMAVTGRQMPRATNPYLFPIIH